MNLAIDIGLLDSLIAITTAIIGGIYYLFRKSENKIKLKSRQRDELSPFFEKPNEEIQKFRENYIRTSGSERPAELGDEPWELHSAVKPYDLYQYFNEYEFKGDNKYNKSIFLILAGAGMGKTTFLINLYLKYSKQLFPSFKIKYIPLVSSESDKYIEAYKLDGSQLKDGGRTILLLDGFDEDPDTFPDYEKRLRDLTNSVQGFRKVIITCRSQFFPDDILLKFSTEIPIISGDKQINKILYHKHLAPFSNKDINEFLDKKFGKVRYIVGQKVVSTESRKQSEKFISLLTDKKRLFARPMLVSNIETLITSKEKIENEYDIYREMIRCWIEREVDKQPLLTPSKQDFKRDLWKFNRDVAILIYVNYISGRGQTIDNKQIKDLASSNKYTLSYRDMISRSLLNRMSINEFKFSHKSIMEFFLAESVALSIFPDLEFNFQAFDFALKLKYQCLARINNTDNKKILFSEESKQPTFFRQFNIAGIKREFECKFLIAVNYDLLELDNMHQYPNLERVYLLDLKNLKGQNITIKFSKTSPIVEERIQNIVSIHLNDFYNKETDVTNKYISFQPLPPLSRHNFQILKLSIITPHIKP